MVSSGPRRCWARRGGVVEFSAAMTHSAPHRFVGAKTPPNGLVHFCPGLAVKFGEDRGENRRAHCYAGSRFTPPDRLMTRWRNCQPARKTSNARSSLTMFLADNRPTCRVRLVRGYCLLSDRQACSVSPVVDAGPGIRIRDAADHALVNGTTVAKAVESDRSFWMTARPTWLGRHHHAPPRCG